MAILQKVNGFILKKNLTRDNDQSMVVFTKELGKILVYGKGAQKITSRRLSSLDSLNYVQMVIREFNQNYFLGQVSLKSSLQSVKSDYKKKKHLLLIVEILDKLTSFNQEDRLLFNYLAQFLINEAKREASDEDFFEQTLGLLRVMGYTLPPLSLRSWSSLEKYIETLSQKTLLSREL